VPYAGGGKGRPRPLHPGQEPRFDAAVCRASYVHACGQTDAAGDDPGLSRTEACTGAVIVLPGCIAGGLGGGPPTQRGARRVPSGVEPARILWTSRRVRQRPPTIILLNAIARACSSCHPAGRRAALADRRHCTDDRATYRMGAYKKLRAHRWARSWIPKQPGALAHRATANQVDDPEQNYRANKRDH
jgi:hypothetical protein